MTTAYALASSDSFVTDGTGATSWLHDLAGNPDNWRIEALVASGDYCEMLAAMLEQIACALPATSVEQYQVQDIVGQLLYIQRHYNFTKRSATLHPRSNQRPQAH